MRIRVLHRILQFYVVLVPMGVSAQLSQESAGRVPVAVVAMASRTSVVPRLDGVLDDAVWETAQVFSDFVQQDPDEGAAVTERTEFRVIYTDEALYIGVRAYDSEPERIAALLTRRDEQSPSDEVRIMIDSYHDRRTGFVFSVNAAGVRRDSYLFDDTNEDDRWDAVWDARTVIDSEGWSAELVIPFNQLRFSQKDVQTFGFNVTRRINRNNELQHWRLIPKSASGMVSLFGDLAGISNIAPPRRLEILPYTVAQMNTRQAVVGNPFRSGRDQVAAAGADIKVGIGSALTLSATVNPDFGQVEADPAQVNLSAFETFFAERRPFFTEGLDIFQFRISDGDGDGSQEELFYTRRIGRRPQGRANTRNGVAERVDRTTILAAAKLSGKTADGWTVGLTGALTDEEGANVIGADGERFRDVVEPRTGYVVGRLARDFRGGLTQVGLFGTAVERAVPDRLSFLHNRAWTGGLDWSHRFADNTYSINGRIVGSHVRGSAEAITRTQQSPARYFQRPDNDYTELRTDRTSLSGFGASVNGGRTAGNWRWRLGLDTRSPGFEVNDIGFQRNADRSLQWLWINRRWLEPGKIFRRFNININQWSVWNYGWDRNNTGGNVNVNYTLLNYWNGWLGVNRQFGGTSSTRLRGGPNIKIPGQINGWMGLATDSRRVLRGSASGWGYREDQSGGRGGGVNAQVAWRPTSNVDLSLSPRIDWNRSEWQFLNAPDIGGNTEYLFGRLQQTTTAVTLRSSITVSTDLSLQLYAEPFISAGEYVGYRQVAALNASEFSERLPIVPSSAVIPGEETVSFDLDADGVFETDIRRPDFTFLSLRSNIVLRWEYKLGSTIFLVWQHGRQRALDEGGFNFGPSVNSLFATPAENVFLFKVNYWLNP